MRISDFFAHHARGAAGKPIDESRVVAACDGCEETFCLADVRRRETGLEAVYVCPECDAEILAVGPDNLRGRIEIRVG